MVGVKYFPEESVIQGITGSPTLQVTISASGQLEAASIRQSSGSRVLDQAALSILRRASPFDPFPESIRVDYDQLIFAYKWQFAESEIPTTASTL
jgi:periplasmic protein TonB